MQPEPNETSRALWIVWGIIVIAAPWLPLWKIFPAGGSEFASLELGLGIILTASFALAAYTAKAKRWSLSWIGEILTMGVGYGIVGAAISAFFVLVGFALVRNGPV
jgi:hypothetical protein